MIDITDKKSLEVAFAQNFASPYFPILAELYLKEGDMRRARLVCAVGLEHDFGNDFGKFILAKIALAEEKPAIAEKWLKQVVINNPSNFKAMRMLIRLEFSLKRSPNTIIKYIQHILQYIPNDVECNEWLTKNPTLSDKVPHREKKVVNSNNNNNVSTKKTIETTSTKDIDYKIEETMATFTMVQVLKTQKHYQQALALLKLLESKNMDADRILKERSEIQSLLSQNEET